MSEAKTLLRRIHEHIQEERHALEDSSGFPYPESENDRDYLIALESTICDFAELEGKSCNTLLPCGKTLTQVIEAIIREECAK